MKYYNINFIKSDFGASRPEFSKDTVDYGKYDTFATKKLPLLDLLDVDTKIVKVTIEKISSSIDYGSICFLNPNGGNVYVAPNDIDNEYSVSSLSVDSEFEYSTIEYVFKQGLTGLINRPDFYILVNEDDGSAQSQYLSIQVSIGENGSPPNSATIKIGYECYPIYEETFGVHVYSDYDARYSPKVTTKLRSFTPISGWTTGTIVYHSRQEQYGGLVRALPYYYCYGDKVYKVGGEFDRAYGREYKFTFQENRTVTTNYEEYVFRKSKRLQNYYNSEEQSSPTCIVPELIDCGIITAVIDEGDLIEPQIYRYYLGYDLSTKLNSNDNYFTIFNPTRQIQEPGIGLTHLTHRWNLVNVQYIKPSEIVGFLTPVFEFLIPGFLTGSGVGFTLIYAAPDLTMKWVFWNGSKFVAGKLAVGTTLFTYAAWIATFIFWLYVYIPERDYVQEDCVSSFLHQFTDTPYIEDAHTIYTNTGLTTNLNGYFSDGVYFYDQTTGSITNKEIVCSRSVDMTHPIVVKDQVITETTQLYGYYDPYCSITPDNGYVDDYITLCLLSYVSGKPEKITVNGYYNVEVSQTITPTDCCDFQECDTITITIPARTFFSTISQQDADNKATEYLNQLIQEELASNTEITCLNGKTPSLYIDGFLTFFTHELKIETNPTEVAIYYDKRINAIPIEGMTLYYDECGCIKVLNGYYAVSGVTPYRLFYHTTNGIIDGIYIMTNSYDTITTTGEPIVFTNLDYSSNWYWYNINQYELGSQITDILEVRNYDTTAIYDFNPYLYKGFLETPETLNDLQVYYDFVTPDYYTAQCGWYNPLIPWITEPQFYFCGNMRTITLDIYQDCDYTNGTTSVRGFYIVGKENDIECPIRNAVDVSISVYTVGNILTATYTATTDPSQSKTFVRFDDQVGPTEAITNIVITSIDSTNPVGKIVYVIGDYHECLCNLQLFFETTDSTAKVIVYNGIAPYDYTWSHGQTTYDSLLNQNTATGLIPNVTYSVMVKDGNGCTITGDIQAGESVTIFDADYIVLEYYHVDGLNLENRTRIVTPNIGQTDQSKYIGLELQTIWPTTGDYFIKFGGNNTGLGSEYVLIDLVSLRSQYSDDEIVIDCRAYWLESASSTPIVIRGSFYKGGEMTSQGINGYPPFGFTNDSEATSIQDISLGFKVITSTSIDPNTSGQRVGVLKYNFATFEIIFDTNDTTTPSV